MKAQDLKLKKNGYRFNCNLYTRNDKFSMSIGRRFPATKTQAEFYVKNGCIIGVLNYEDVNEVIEPLLQKHGLAGEYKYTKSGTWVRLQNNDDLCKALKAEYNF